MENKIEILANIIHQMRHDGAYLSNDKLDLINHDINNDKNIDYWIDELSMVLRSCND